MQLPYSFRIFAEYAPKRRGNRQPELYQQNPAL